VGVINLGAVASAQHQQVAEIQFAVQLLQKPATGGLIEGQQFANGERSLLKG
nr:hypothetical protein [Tanacetum cinerariifolium]